MGPCFSCCSKDRLPNHNKSQASSHTANQTAPSCLPKSELMGRATSSILRHPHSSRSVEDPPALSHRSSASVGQNAGNTKLFAAQKLTVERKSPAGGGGAAGEPSKRVTGSSREVSDGKIISMFETYRDPDADCILEDGIVKLCNDLNVQPEEFRVLLLAWKFGAEVMCRFTRAEFVEGCRRLQVDSVRLLQNHLPDLLDEVKNKDRFRDLYRWTYTFGLDSERLQRTLPADMAISLWRLVFSSSEPPILARWISFLEKHPSIHGIPKDTWDTFLNFAEAIEDDLSNYDDTEAWPALFDDFVEYENDRQNQNLVSDLSEKDSNPLT